MKNLTGKKFGRLSVIKQTGKDKNGHSLWLCKCDCGKEKIILGISLQSGCTKSCGCLKKELDKKRNLKHNHAQRGKVSKTYNSWVHMIQRCTNPNCEIYKHYGGRGIKVCKRWLKFENFLEDIGEIPKGLTLDRVDNNKGYSPKNCKLSTIKEQSRNKRNNILIPFNDGFLCLKDYCKIKNLNYSTVLWRLNKMRMSIEEALTLPIDQRYSRGRNYNE